MVQKVHTQLHFVFLFCFIIITQLLWISSKSELKFLCFIHRLVLNLKDWIFGVILTRHFRPKSDCLNERIYIKPIDKTSKMLFIEWSGSFLRPNIFELLKLLVFGLKRNRNITRLWKYFPQKTKVSTICRKYRKIQFWIQWLFICDKIYLTKATSRSLSM